jgi:thiosulfate dehydrogenase
MNWSAAGLTAVIFIAALSAYPIAGRADNGSPQATPTAATVSVDAPKSSDWVIPDVDKLPSDAWGKLVRLGRDLTTNTYSLIGPETPDPARHFAGNNLSCQSCHLEAGTKKLGLPFVGVFADFPQYRAREGEVGTLEDRINGCMTRSMNGRVLPLDSVEMKAYVA